MDWWLGFPVFTQATLVQFLHRQQRSCFRPPLTAVSLRSKCLLQQQNTKKQQGTKNNCLYACWWKLWTTRHKKTKIPTVISEEQVPKTGNPEKSRVLQFPLHTTPGNTQANHLSQSYSLTPTPTPILIPCKKPARHPSPPPHGKQRTLLLALLQQESQ